MEARNTERMGRCGATEAALLYPMFSCSDPQLTKLPCP
jgi:hypothetical protein